MNKDLEIQETKKEADTSQDANQNKLDIEQNEIQKNKDPEKIKVLIIGGTGEMGQWFTRFFKEKGYSVTVWGKGGKTEIARKLEVPFASDLECRNPKKRYYNSFCTYQCNRRNYKRNSSKNEAWKPPYGFYFYKSRDQSRR